MYRRRLLCFCFTASITGCLSICTTTRTGPIVSRDHDKHLSDNDLIKAANKLGVSLPIIRAVYEVESKGSGFLADGRPTILFERHVFYRRLQYHQVDPKQFVSHFPNVLSLTPGGYRSYSGEHKRLAAAERIHSAAARESASWGSFQIMGYHWKALAYSSIDDFVRRMHRHETEHLDAFVRFVSANPSMHSALAAKRWTAFARGYNGRQHARHRYADRLAQAYQKYVERERDGEHTERP